MKDPASHYFKCTPRERAVFEAGIKLGTVYHHIRRHTDKPGKYKLHREGHKGKHNGAALCGGCRSSY
nr:dihydroneopterin aldolase family protein [Thermoplasma acidophilum]